MPDGSVMRSAAFIFGVHAAIAIHPAGVDTPMIDNEFTRKWLSQLTSDSEAAKSAPNMTNALPVQVLEAEDIVNTVAWLVSDAGRYITGVTLPVGGGDLG